MAYVPTGKSLSDPLPDITVEVVYGAGGSASGVGSRSILILADGTADGYAAAAAVYELQSESEAAYLFGGRSAVMQAFRAISSANKDVKVEAIKGTESVGVAASGTITIAGTAVKPGVVDVWIAGQKISASFAKDDAHTTISAALESAINAVSWLPCEAVDVAGEITLTASNVGPYGNDIRIRTEVTSGSGVTSVASGVTLESGATAADIAAALTALEGSHYYYIVSGYNDAASIQALVEHLQNQADPSEGNLQVGRVGYTGTVSAANSIAQNALVNEERLSLIQCNKAEGLPIAIAAEVAAKEQKQTASYFGYNFQGMVLKAKGPASVTDYPTKSDVRSGLNSGVSALQAGRDGVLSISRLITTRSLLGDNPDYRVRTANIVSVGDAFNEYLSSLIVARFTGKKVSADTSTVPGVNVRQPKHLRAAIIDAINAFSTGIYRDNLDVSRVDEMIESIAVAKDAGILSAQVDIFVMNDLVKVWIVAREGSESF